MADAGKNDGTRSYDRDYILLGLRIVGEFGAIIAVPVVVLSIIGKRMDSAYGTTPMFTIAAFVIAFALSAYSVNRKARRFADEYQAIVDKERKDTDKKGSSRSNT